jgi:hypothetical protein
MTTTATATNDDEKNDFVDDDDGIDADSKKVYVRQTESNYRETAGTETGTTT